MFGSFIFAAVGFFIFYLIYLIVILSVEHEKILSFINHEAIDIIEDYKKENNIRNNFLNIIVLLLFIILLPINYYIIME